MTSTSNVTGYCSDPSKMSQRRQQFETEKAEAIEACQNNPTLLAQVNSINPHKGAIEELEALIALANQQAAESQKNLNFKA